MIIVEKDGKGFDAVDNHVSSYLYCPEQEYEKVRKFLAKTHEYHHFFTEIMNVYQRALARIRSVTSSGKFTILGKNALYNDSELVRLVTYLKENWPNRKTNLTNSLSSLFDLKKAYGKIVSKTKHVKAHPQAGLPVVYKTTNKSKNQVKGEQRRDKEGNLLFYPETVDVGWTFLVDFDQAQAWLTLWEEQGCILAEEIRLRSKEVDNAKLELDRFELTRGVIEFERNSTAPAKYPEHNKKQWIRSEWLEPLTWYAWPDNIAIYSGMRFNSSANGIGAGEFWLGYLFGGQVQGQGVAFDLAVSKGDDWEHWEVKEYDEKNKLIRLGTHGTEAVVAMSTDMNEILQEFKRFIEAYDSLGISLWYSNDTWLGTFVESLREYLDRRYAKIVVKGEISNIELRELQTATTGVRKALELIAKEHSGVVKQTRFTDLCLDSDRYARLLYLFHSENLSSLDFDERMVALSSVVKHPVMRGLQPFGRFVRDWVCSLDPSKAFGDVAGFFLVNKKGFMMIPREKINDILEYYRMSLGHRPNFKVSNLDSLNEVYPITQMLPLSGTFEIPPVNVNYTAETDTIASMVFEDNVEDDFFKPHWQTYLPFVTLPQRIINSSSFLQKEYARFGQANPGAFINVTFFNE